MPRLPELSQSEWEALYAKHLSCEKIASELGVSEGGVRVTLKRLGIARRAVGSHRRGVTASNLVSIEGQRFGRLVVESFSHSVRGYAHWTCLCDCGKRLTMRSSSIRRGLTQSCGCIRVEKQERNDAVGKLSASYFRRIKRGAELRGLTFDVTPQQLWDLYTKQNGTCDLTGMPIMLERPYKPKQTASLDRIDSSKGYTIDNVVWLHKDVNILKNNYSVDEFVGWCRRVAEHSAKNS